MLSNILDPRPDFRHFLFIRGFLITNGDLPLPDKDYTGSPDHGITESRITPIPDDGQPTTDNRRRTTDNRQPTTDNRQPTTAHYPFYGHWSTTSIGPFRFHIHNLQTLYTVTRGARTYFLIGHAYNPFTMEHEEIPILEKIAEAGEKGQSGYTDAVDELTGLFITGYISGNDITFLLDCSGMQYACYGEIGGQLYIASHMQLIGDICHLETDPFVKKLIQYRWYKYMMGNYLPGELTAFTPVRRIIPNTLVRYAGNGFEVVRFYPSREIAMCTTKEEYDQVIRDASEIMKNNMLLITRKWKRPAISLTGGIDSNTTFAAANGVYDKYRTFSYISMFRESVDAEAAKQISDRFSVPHTVYQVPDTNEAFPDFEIYKRILSHNDGDIGPTKDNDTRKNIVLMQNDVGDVEVKSWISETIRDCA